MNNREFLEGLRQQDNSAIRHFAECLLPSLWRFVYFRVKGDLHLAEDIASETTLALVRFVKENSVDIENPSAWLRTVATRKIQDHFRAVARVQHLIDQAAATGPVNQSTDPLAREEAEETRAAVRKAVDDLPDQHRLALEWKYIDRLSVREIAARLDTTEKAAEAILFRARRDLRHQLGRFDQETPAVNSKHREPQVPDSRSVMPDPSTGAASP